MLLPRLREFKPDLLLISAGFDTHYDDFYHFLTEEDIHWITDEMCRIVDEVGGHGVVSVLEGGYSLSSPIVSSVPSKSTGKSSGDTYGTRGKKKNTSSSDDPSSVSALPIIDSHSMFSQLPGDGGLVKG